MSRLLVHQGQSFTRYRVSYSCQPACLLRGQTVDVTTKGLKEQYLRELRKDQTAPGIHPIRLIHRETNGICNPFTGWFIRDMDLKHPWQRSQNDFAKLGIAGHEAAHESRGFTTPAESHYLDSMPQLSCERLECIHRMFRQSVT